MKGEQKMKDSTDSFDEMLKYKSDFEQALKIDRALECYGVIVNPLNVYEASKQYTHQQLKTLASYYKYRATKHSNPAQLLVSIILNKIVQK